MNKKNLKNSLKSHVNKQQSLNNNSLIEEKRNNIIKIIKEKEVDLTY